MGVLHAALVALRSAHVPRALRATLLQQVREKSGWVGWMIGWLNGGGTIVARAGCLSPS